MQPNAPPQPPIVQPGWDEFSDIGWTMVLVVSLIAAGIIFGAVWLAERHLPTAAESQREAQAAYYSQTTHITNSPARQDTE